MAQQPFQASHPHLVEDYEGLKSNWLWFMILGLGILVLGIAAVSCSLITEIATLVSVTLFGIFILVAGIAQVISAFWSPKWSGLIVTLLIGLLYTVVGFMLVDQPIVAAAGLTLLIAVFLIVGGIFRIATALIMRYRHWGLYLLNGTVSLVLGIIVWRLMLDSEAAYLWIIGIFVGIEMIFAGASWIAFALAVKNLPDDTGSAGAAA